RVGASYGLFSNPGGGVGRLMLTGDGAPDTSSTSTLATYASSASGTPLFNSAGQAAYLANLTVSSAPTPPVVITSGIGNAAGLWVGTPGNTHLAFRQNDTLLGLDATGNTRIGSLSSNLSLSFNGNGHYAMQMSLQGSNVVTGNGVGGNSTMIASN